MIGPSHLGPVRLALVSVQAACTICDVAQNELNKMLCAYEAIFIALGTQTDDRAVPYCAGETGSFESGGR